MRAKTIRRASKAPSAEAPPTAEARPAPEAPATETPPAAAPPTEARPATAAPPAEAHAHTPTPAPAKVKAPAASMTADTEAALDHLFMQESRAALRQQWARLDRGLRVQRLRAFAAAYPGLKEAEAAALARVLIDALDAKLLNSKQRVVWDAQAGVIADVKGLCMARRGSSGSGSGSGTAIFRLDTVRATKKRSVEGGGSAGSGGSSSSSGSGSSSGGGSGGVAKAGMEERDDDAAAPGEDAMVFSASCAWLDDWLTAAPPEALADEWDLEEWVAAEAAPAFEAGFLEWLTQPASRRDALLIVRALLWETFKWQRGAAIAALDREGAEARADRVARLRGAAQTEQRTAAWLAEKAHLLTAAEFGAVVLGTHARRQAVVVSKALGTAAAAAAAAAASNGGEQHTVFLTPAGGRIAANAWGWRYEPVLRDLYAACVALGDVFDGLGRLRHPHLPRLAASPDGIVTSGPRAGRLVELKNPVSRDLDGTVPPDYFCQMQLQAEVCTAPAVDYMEARLGALDAAVVLQDGFTPPPPGDGGAPALVGAVCVVAPTVAWPPSGSASASASAAAADTNAAELVDLTSDAGSDAGSDADSDRGSERAFPRRSDEASDEAEDAGPPFPPQATWRYEYSPHFPATAEGWRAAAAWVPAGVAAGTDTLLEHHVWHVQDWHTEVVPRNPRWWAAVGQPAYEAFWADVDALRADPARMAALAAAKAAKGPRAAFLDEDDGADIECGAPDDGAA